MSITIPATVVDIRESAFEWAWTLKLVIFSGESTLTVIGARVSSLF